MYILIDSILIKGHPPVSDRVLPLAPELGRDGQKRLAPPGVCVYMYIYICIYIYIYIHT